MVQSQINLERSCRYNQLFSDYCKALYSTDHLSVREVNTVLDSVTPPQLNVVDKDFLESPIQFSELISDTDSLKLNKAPGTDGFM